MGSLLDRSQSWLRSWGRPFYLLWFRGLFHTDTHRAKAAPLCYMPQRPPLPMLTRSPAISGAFAHNLICIPESGYFPSLFVIGCSLIQIGEPDVSFYGLQRIYSITERICIFPHPSSPSSTPWRICSFLSHTLSEVLFFQR